MGMWKDLFSMKWRFQRKQKSVRRKGRSWGVSVGRHQAAYIYRDKWVMRGINISDYVIWE